MSTDSSTKPRRERTPNPSQVVRLPDYVHLSEHELSLVARLVRLTRNSDHWLGTLIECLLSRDEMSYEEVETLLVRLKTLASCQRFFQQLISDWPMVAAHNGFASAKTGRQSANVDEDGFADLVKMWRNEYPEPRSTQSPSSRHEEGD